MENVTHDGRYAGKRVAITINETKEFPTYYIAEELGQYVPKYLLDSQQLEVIEGSDEEYADNILDGVYQCGLKDAWELAKEFVEDFLNPQCQQDELVKKYGLNPEWGDSMIDLFFSQNPLKAVDMHRIKNKNIIYPGDTFILNGENYICVESDIDTGTITITKMDDDFLIEAGDEAEESGDGL